MLARVGVEEEVDDRALQPRAQPLIKMEARAADLGGGFGVEDAEVAPDVPVRLRLERKLRRLAAAAHLQILAVVPADGYALVGQVGDGEQHVLQFFFQLGLTRVVLLDAAGSSLSAMSARRAPSSATALSTSAE